MRVALLAGVLVAGCAAEPELAGSSRVEILEFPVSPPVRADLVVVLDDTPALAAHADAIAATLDYWQSDLDAFDARIAVVATSRPDVLRVGSAGELPTLLALGSAAGTGETLAAMQVAVASPDVALLRRPEAELGIVILAGADDVSPGAISDYAAAIAPLRPYVYVLGPLPSTRLLAFADAFPNRGRAYQIETSSYICDDLGPPLPLDRPVLDPCFAVPVDPATCVVTLGDAILEPPAYTIANDCLALHTPPPTTTVTLLAECVSVGP